jgi:hypothetical protein
MGAIKIVDDHDYFRHNHGLRVKKREYLPKENSMSGLCCGQRAQD